MTETPRAATADEARYIFLHHLANMARYWAKQEGDKLDVCNGLVHSILCVFDGVSGGFPCALDLVISVHPSDEQYHKDNGENWYVKGQTINGPGHMHTEWPEYSRR